MALIRWLEIELEIQNDELRRPQEALEASQGRYIDLYDFAPVGYLSVSKKGLILKANLSAATLFGVSRSEMLKQPLSSFILPEDQDIYYKHFRQLSTLNTAAPKIPQKPQSCELQETQAQYLHAEKLSAIGKLSASIAHELFNPLQSIMTILQSLQKGAVLPEEDRTFVELAIVESRRIRSLIQNLHDFNRPSSGKKELMDIHQAIDSLLMLCRKDFDKKQITVVRDFAEKLPLILAVEDQIKQVLINLLTNAAEACTQSDRVITISTRLEEKWPVMAIKDTGVGIAPDKLNQIFQPFHTTKAEVKGIGLGLSISHGIIQSHQGKIQIKSKPGEGSTFTVLLPV